jgi:hypothetical protein
MLLIYWLLGVPATIGTLAALLLRASLDVDLLTEQEVRMASKVIAVIYFLCQYTCSSSFLK